ncbi:hypothetical protein [Tabrizicola soli]|uniref:hypothetical protein n=1 Tax=Tabrizicola soli TaxID=2185115 RepID=UPI0018D31A2D|nr:hypothetical protein [Tabrizicola soli]
MRVGDQITAGNFQHSFPGGLQLLQMRCLVRIALFLQQRRILGVFSRLRPLAAHAHQVERRCMGTAHEPHQVGRREKDVAAEVPHGRPEIVSERNPNRNRLVRSQVLQ